MRYLEFICKPLLVASLLYSLAYHNQTDTLKSKQEKKPFFGYKYELVGEVADSVYEKSFEEYDFDGDGIVDRCGEDVVGLEGIAVLWRGFREDDSIPKGGATDFYFGGAIAKIQSGSSDDIKFFKNEQGQLDLLVKYEDNDTVKVLLYRNKIEVKESKPK